jgi:hypothetical protein
MSDPLDQVLHLVAEGRLTAAEAEPILAALDTHRSPPAPPDAPPPVDPPRPPGAPMGPRFARIEVLDGGRQVVNLRIPIALGWTALKSIPGLSPDHAASLRAAVDAGSHGPILDVVDEHGDGARIVLE